MLTKQQQQILDNAPDWATHHMSHDKQKSDYAVFTVGCYYDNTKIKNPPFGAEYDNTWHIKPLSDLRKKQGKTVMDAVSAMHTELVGYEDNGDSVILETIKPDPYYPSEHLGHVSCGCDEFNSEFYTQICTIEEFNQCVDDLAKFANRDKPIYTVHHHDYEQHKLDNPKVNKKMKVEYVRVDKDAEGGVFWECARDYAEADADIFFSLDVSDGDVRKILSNNHLLGRYELSNLYRKVETEVNLNQEQVDAIMVDIDSGAMNGGSGYTTRDLVEFIQDRGWIIEA